MKTRTLIIILSLTMGLLTACTDKKKAKKTVETEMTSEDNIDADEKRKLDSIRQVKEHGHAH